MIEVRCICGESYHADDSHAGRSLKCTKCGAVLVVEAPRELAAAPPIKPIVNRMAPSITIDATPPVVAPVARAIRRSKLSFVIGLAVLAIAVVVFAWWVNRESNEEIQNAARQAAQTPTPKQALPSIPPCAEGQTPGPLANGARIRPDRGREGAGEMKVANGTSRDATVRLLDALTHRTARFFYIRAGHGFTVGSIEPGTYIVQFSTGTEWVSACGKFIRDASYQKFDEKLEFDETGNGYELTLHNVPGGHATTSTIDEFEFFEGDESL